MQARLDFSSDQKLLRMEQQAWA